MKPRESFAEMASRADEAIELDRASLLIAAEEYPDLLLQDYLDRLDLFALRVRRSLHADAGPRESLARLNRVLFEEEGFHGNTEDYYDPRNSYLNQVLDRRTGIPITLCLVYMEVARRIGLSLQGVGFPGHFLVKHQAEDGELLIDAFAGGQILSLEECRQRIHQLFGGKVELESEHLRATSSRQMLARLLNNLKSIYVGRRDDQRALAAVERLLILEPGSAREIRDRGVLLSRVGRPLEALGELVRYRKLSPEAEDGERVDSLIDRLRLRVGMSN